MAGDESERDDLLDRLGEEFAARLRRGERPSLKEYTQRYPELADEIDELFPAMMKVEQVKEICHDWDGTDTGALALSQVGDYRIIREIGRGGMGVVYEAEQISLGRRVALKVLPQQSARDRTTLARFRREARASARLHHTNIVPVFEVGQDGEVSYYAMQLIQGQSLDSVIDELRRLRGKSPAGQSNRPAAVGRREPHRFNSGTSGNAASLRLAQTLLSGRFEQGLSVVAERFKDDVPEAGSPCSVEPEPSPPAVPDTSAVMPGGAQLSSVESRHRTYHRGVAHIGRQAASALAYAHARGIVHRDIKPSNLLLDTEGVVWVSDFGLARVDEDDLTRTGDILGTLRYMAPERFRGRGDARADLYSLGLTLYELLVLRPAFDSHDRVALSEQIKNVEPSRPRSIDPRVPRDLETIVLKAIDKDPRTRYASAEALAEDLRRFLDDEPILARRAGAPERYMRWARRNPVVAILGGVLTAVLVGVTIASVLIAGRMAAQAGVNEREKLNAQTAQARAQAAQTQAEADRTEADRQRERAEHHLYIARIGQADSALRLYDSATARGLLDQCRPQSGSPDRRGWEWFYLDQWCRPELQTIALPTSAVTQAIAVSPDGRFLAVGCSHPSGLYSGAQPDVPAYLISLPDGGIRHELVGHNEWVLAVAFRPDGERLATLGAEGTIRVWDTGSGRQLRSIALGKKVAPSPGERTGLRWSPDGRRIASSSGDGPVQVWDPQTGSETARFGHRVRTASWSPDGTRIASGGESGLEVRLWDDREGVGRAPYLRIPADVLSFCWSADSRRLASAHRVLDRDTVRYELNVWDSKTGETLHRADHATEASAVAFSPDGILVATGGNDGIVHLFDTAAGRERATLFTSCMNISGLAFTSDGRRLFVSGWGMGGVKVFDPGRDPRGRSTPHWLDQIGDMKFDREGLRVLGVGWHHPKGLASADPVAGKVTFERELGVIDTLRWPRGDFSFSPDARWLAAPTRRDPKVVAVWDVALRQLIAKLRGSGGPVTAVVFHPDGQLLATAAAGSKGWPVVTVWDLPSSRAIVTFRLEKPDPVLALAWSNDGRKLAAGGGTTPGTPGWVTVWDWQTRGVLAKLDRVGLVKFLAFHPDGARLAVADYGESRVHLWDFATGTLITNPGPEAISCVRFTPDGKRLVAIGYDGNVHLADARTGDELLTLRHLGPPPGSNGFTPRVAISPDGSRIAANAMGVEHPLNVWDLAPRSGLSDEPEIGDLAGWLRRSRALAEQGDVAGADAAYRYACEVEGGDPSAWIEHAVTLGRRGDSTQVRDSLKRAMSSLSDDAGRWLDLSRLLGRIGRMQEAEKALVKTRSLLEQRLSRVPDDEIAAGALAGILADTGAETRWTMMQPAVMHSSGGATLTRLSDGSVLASGANPVNDFYTVEGVAGLSEIRGLRLDVLPDASLPFCGPGRSGLSGNFHMNQIRLSTIRQARAKEHREISLTSARADFSQLRGGIQRVIGPPDMAPETCWAILPESSRVHWAVFEPAEPLHTGAGSWLRVEMSFRIRSGGLALGRFRLSVTNQPVLLSEPTLMRVKADLDRSGFLRLGAAHYVRGEWASAAVMLERSVARADASAIDEFLLALAHHHMGRIAEARRECERAFQRLTTEPVDNETRAIALEALTTIRSLKVDEAELLLLDAAFPTDPFSA